MTLSVGPQYSILGLMTMPGAQGPFLELKLFPQFQLISPHLKINLADLSKIHLENASSPSFPQPPLQFNQY